jgi:hypothetical protein
MISLPSVLSPTEDGELTEERCPWCDQAIPHEKFAEIRDRIQGMERQRTAAVELRLKTQFEQRMTESESKRTAEVGKAKAEAAAAVVAAKKGAVALVEAARLEGRKALQALHAPALAAAEAAKVSAEKKLASLQETAEATIKKRLVEQRGAMEEDKAKALGAEKSRNFKERQKLEEKLQLVQRQLQKQRADELGEGAELDLFDELRKEFPSDDIKRVGKGQEGADIVHKVVHSGHECGCIVYDSKNRAAWRNDYVTKLRRDQLAAKADHAVLSTNVFPAGSRQLHLQDGVILASPARIAALAQMLRNQLLQLDSFRLSKEERSEKMGRMYEFITSEHCSQLLEHIDSRAEEMLELDVAEKRRHDATWRTRGELIRSVQQARADLSGEIERIVSAPIVPLRKAQ